jgi:1-aminocyclopropane-1-carboxylate deaminase/D-cysteine desulfhydrase-like pyridoxal-dependent ACC family enzyme
LLRLLLLPPLPTDAEQEVALATGVLLDPVYSGKALHALLSDMRAAPEQWSGKKVLFVHTGGLLVSVIWLITRLRLFHCC